MGRARHRRDALHEPLRRRPGARRGAGARGQRAVPDRDRGRRVGGRCAARRRRRRRDAHVHALLRHEERADQRDRVVVRRDRHVRPNRICAQPLGVRLSGLSRIPQLRLGRRRVRHRASSPTRSTRMATAETNRGTYLRLDGTRFVRMPGGGRQLPRRAGPSRARRRGLARGTGAHHARPRARSGCERRWPVSARAPLAAIADRARRARRATSARARSRSGPTAPSLRYQPGQGWTREFLLTSIGQRSYEAPCAASPGPRPRAHMRWATSARCGCGARETGLWERDPGAPIGFEANLMDVAFEPGNPDRGYAVGTGGALLSYDKSWIQQPLPGGFGSARPHADRVRRVPGDRRRRHRPAGQRRRRLAGRRGRTRSCCDSMPGETAAVRRRRACPTAAPWPPGSDVVIERDGRRLAVALRRPAAARLDRRRGRRRSARAARVRAVGLGRARPVSAYPPVDDVPPADPNGPPPLLPAFPLPRRRLRAARDRRRAGATSSTRPSRARATTGRSSRTRSWTSLLDSAGTRLGGRRLERRAGQRRARLLRDGSRPGELDRTRVQTAAVFRYGDGGRRSPPRRTGIRRPAGRVPARVRGRRPRRRAQAACSDLALQGIRPGPRRWPAALAKVAALHAQPERPADAALHRRPPGPGRARRIAPRPRAGRYAALLGIAPGLPVYPAVSRTDAPRASRRSQLRSQGFTAPFGGGRARRPAWTPPASSPAQPAAPGARTHYAFDSAGRRRAPCG